MADNARASLDSLSLSAAEGQGGEDVWVDILPLVQRASEELDVGELLHGELFSLQESMSALEMMDPQMDSGMEGSAARAGSESIPAAWDAEAQQPRWPAALDVPQSIGWADELLARLALYLQGHPLTSTLLTCACAHRPGVIGCPILRAFTLAALRVADVSRAAVSRANVADEEDWSVQHGATLSQLGEGVAEAEVREGLARAERRVLAALGGVPDDAAPDDAAPDDASAGLTDADLRAAPERARRALLHRLVLVRALLETLAPLRAHGGLEAGAPSAPGGAAEVPAIRAAQDALAGVRDTSAEGSAEVAFVCAHFSAACALHVRGNAPQRVTPPPSREGSRDGLAEMLEQLAALPALLRAPSLDELLDGYHDLAVRRTLQPLPSAALRVVVLVAHEAHEALHEEEEEAAGGGGGGAMLAPRPPPPPTASLRWQVARALRAYNARLDAPVLDALLGRPDVRVGVERAAQAVLVHLQVYCHNHARRRRKFCKLLPEWGGMQLELEELDIALQEEGAVPRGHWLFSTWLAEHTLGLVLEQLCSGFGLRLYHPTEWHMAFWYGTFVCALGAQLHASVARAIQEADAARAEAAAAAAAAAKGGGAGKKGAKGSSKAAAAKAAARAAEASAREVAARPPPCATPRALVYQALRELFRGGQLLTSALARTGAQPIADSEFMSLHTRFERRFGHLRMLTQPSALPWTKYAPLLPELHAHSATELFGAAAQCFKLARAPLEAALKWDGCPLGAPFEAELRALVRVAVANGVACMRMADRHGAGAPAAAADADGAPPPARAVWEHGAHRYFPVLKP